MFILTSRPCHPERSAEGAESKDASRAPGLLIVDELGRLEIWRGGGLTSAMALLAQGPTPVFPHALAVVRDYLLDDAEALLAEAWPDRCRIKPNDAAREAIRQLVPQPFHRHRQGVGIHKLAPVPDRKSVV